MGSLLYRFLVQFSTYGGSGLYYLGVFKQRSLYPKHALIRLILNSNFQGKSSRTEILLADWIKPRHFIYFALMYSCSCQTHRDLHKVFFTADKPEWLVLNEQKVLWWIACIPCPWCPELDTELARSLTQNLTASTRTRWKWSRHYLKTNSRSLTQNLTASTCTRWKWSRHYLKTNSHGASRRTSRQAHARGENDQGIILKQTHTEPHADPHGTYAHEVKMIKGLS